MQSQRASRGLSTTADFGIGGHGELSTAGMVQLVKVHAIQHAGHLAGSPVCIRVTSSRPYEHGWFIDNASGHCCHKPPAYHQA